MGSILLDIAFGLLPVLLFLAALMTVDSYKLVHLRTVTGTIVAGCVAALCAFLVNNWLAISLFRDWMVYTRYVSPVIEEGIKAVYLFYLMRTNRVGFMVDAAIVGFSIGAGFALVENLFYLYERPDADLYLWVIRGFGTAIMHGGTTAIVGIMGKRFTDDAGTTRLSTLIPGLATAMVIHSLFNHFFLNPLLSTILILVLLPAVTLVIFRESEKATRSWLGIGFDSDRELLEMITSGVLAENKVGQYLQSLENRFRGETVADMLCYLRLHLELSVRAKGLLLMREAGFEVPPDPEVKEQFAELKFLEKSIGTTGKLALHPFLHTRSKDLWQITMLRS